jgi:hypothetical protein
MTRFSARSVCIGLLVGAIGGLIDREARADRITLHLRSLEGTVEAPVGITDLEFAEIEVFRAVKSDDNNAKKVSPVITMIAVEPLPQGSLKVVPGRGTQLSNGRAASDKGANLEIDLNLPAESVIKTVVIVANRRQRRPTSALTCLVLDGKSKELTIAVPVSEPLEVQPPICDPPPVCNPPTYCYVQRRPCCLGGLFQRRCQ